VDDARALLQVMEQWGLCLKRSKPRND
jgi:hypothetical protein